MSYPAIIKLENIEKEFGKGIGKVKVLKDIDLEINAGEFVIIFGHSGSGKSTLLNTISGLEKPTLGKAYLKGIDLYSLSEDKRAKIRNKNFGIVYQQSNWIKPLNILENVAFSLNVSGYPYKSAITRSRRGLELFNVAKFVKSTPTELSGGQQQKVSIVRALISNPSIILADEPTGNMDKTSADDIMYIFKSLNEEFKRTVVMVTHNPDYEKYGTKIIRMEDGEIKSIKINKKISLNPDLKLKDIIFE